MGVKIVAREKKEWQTSVHGRWSKEGDYVF